MLMRPLAVPTKLQQDILADLGTLLSCPFLRKPLLRVAEKMPAFFSGLTRNAKATVGKEKAAMQ
jgi:hypothetical protein